MGCKTEVAFAQLLDVDSFDGRAVFSTISVLKSHFGPEFFADKQTDRQTNRYTWLHLLTQVCKSQPKADVELPI